MLVTLEVSKLSGWLNADADCRESKGAHTGCGPRYTGREAGGRRVIAVHATCREGLDCRSGAGHGEERTPNMAPMFVTLEVSKLSGWLNTDASCMPRVERRAYGAGRGAGLEAGDGRRQTTAAHATCKGGLDCRLGAGHGEERTKNIVPMSVTPEVSKLSGWLNADAACRESEGGHAVPGEVGGRARGGAHAEHCGHVRDAGGVEAQRLIERRRGLPRVERRACCVRGEVRAAGGGSEGGWRLRCKQGAGEGLTTDWG
eukprot:scaffold60773_cov44-Phaeocystis_antarctica.AAC.5